MSKRSLAIATAIASTAVAALAVSGSALAHPGSHDGLGLAELARHLASGWHLVTFAGGVLIGVGLIAIGLRRDRARYVARRRGDQS